jgi:hypothetical protein
VNDAYPLPPPSSFPRKKSPEDNGSLGTGIGLAWAIAVVGTPLCIAFTATLHTGSDQLFVLWLLPYLLIVILAIVSYRKGKPRTGHGFLLGLLSIFAVALLLVAACFGMFAGR